MKARVTGAGSLAMASAVALVLTPRPPTISATRARQACREAASRAGRRHLPGRTPSAAIFGIGPVWRHFEEFLVHRWRGRTPVLASTGAGITTSWRAPGLAVDDGDRREPGGSASLPGACRRRAWAGPSYRPGPPGLRASCSDRCFRAPPTVFAGRRGLCMDRHDDHRLAAEWVVPDDRPQHEHCQEQRRAPRR